MPCGSSPGLASGPVGPIEGCVIGGSPVVGAGADVGGVRVGFAPPKTKPGCGELETGEAIGGPPTGCVGAVGNAAGGFLALVPPELLLAKLGVIGGIGGAV